MNTGNLALLLTLSFLSLDKAALLSAQSVTGYLEGVNSGGTVRGWSYDPRNPTASNIVQFFIDGTSPINYIAQVNANIARPDVNTVMRIGGNHGFSWVIPTQYRDGQPHRVYVVGLAANTSAAAAQLPRSPAAFTIGSVIAPPVLPSAQSVTGYLEGVNSGGTVRGWSYDPRNPTASNIVQFFIDGTSQINYITQGNANIARPDVNIAMSIGGNHGFSWVIPTQYWDGQPHTVYVVGLAANTSAAAAQLPRSPAAFTIGGVVPPPVPGHIKFFGYFGNAGLSSGDYLNEVHIYNNLAWIQGYELSKFQEAVGYNMKAVLDVTPVFFDVTTWRLHVDYQQRWVNYAQQIQSLSQNVAAFYPIDEPYLNAQSKGVSSQEMLAYLNTIVATIKQTFPTAAVAGIFSGPEVVQGFPVPQGFDWVGVDCYDKFWNCSGHSIPWYYTELKKQLSANQKLMIVPPAFFLGSAPTVQDEDQMMSTAEQYFAYAESEPSVIAVVPYVYQTLNSAFIGCRDIPRLKTKFEDLGTNLLRSIP